MQFTKSLKENYLFRKLYARGKHVSGPHLAVYAKKNRSVQSRFGITVGAKVGKAVQRNRVRRRLREAYRIHERQMIPGWDIVVVARMRAVSAPYAELERELLGLLQKIGVKRREDP